MLRACTGFEWDEGNSNKNRQKHGVSDSDCEQIFFNDPLLAYRDSHHSDAEPRLYALGRTDSDRRLFIAFTIRNQKIRVISARNMTHRELRRYPA